MHRIVVSDLGSGRKTTTQRISIASVGVYGDVEWVTGRIVTKYKEVSWIVVTFKIHGITELTKEYRTEEGGLILKSTFCPEVTQVTT